MIKKQIATASDTETNEPLQQASTEPLPEQVQATAVESVETNESIVVQQRRGLLDQKLKDFRQEKLKRKIPMDKQLLDHAKEELQVKKMLIDHMDKVDKDHSETMAKLSSNMEKLTDSIADGFSLLRNLLTPQPPQSQHNIYPPYHFGDLQQGRPHNY